MTPAEVDALVAKWRDEWELVRLKDVPAWTTHRAHLDKFVEQLDELLAALAARPAAPPDDLVALVREYQRAFTTEARNGEPAAVHKLLLAEQALLTWTATAPVAAPAPVALARWLQRTKPQPEEWRSRDGELPQMGGGSAGYLDALQSWNEAREAAGLPHGFEANTDAFSLQNVAAPAPETPASFPSADLSKLCTCGHAVNVHGNNGVGACHECRCQFFAAPETPTPDAMPECPNCGGMGTTFHDILVGGTEHDTEERDCDVCKGTGLASPAPQPAGLAPTHECCRTCALIKPIGQIFAIRNDDGGRYCTVCGSQLEGVWLTPLASPAPQRGESVKHDNGVAVRCEERAGHLGLHRFDGMAWEPAAPAPQPAAPAPASPRLRGGGIISHAEIEDARKAQE